MLLGIFLLFIIVACTIGFVLSIMINNKEHIAFKVDKNNGFIIFIRWLFYGITLLVLTPAFFNWVNSLNGAARKVNVTVLLRYRHVTLANIVLYECMFVQDLFTVFIQWGINYVR